MHEIEAHRTEAAKAAWSAEQRVALAHKETAAARHENTMARQAAAVNVRWLYIMACYGILVTMFTAAYSGGFMHACSELWSMITDKLLPAIYVSLQVPAWAAHLTDSISHDAWRPVCYWAVLLGICGEALFALQRCLRWIQRFCVFYRIYMADWISLSVLLVSLAVAVFFAEQINVAINALIMMMLINLVYTIVRSIRTYQNLYKTRRKIL